MTGGDLCAQRIGDGGIARGIEMAGDEAGAHSELLGATGKVAGKRRDDQYRTATHHRRNLPAEVLPPAIGRGPQQRLSGQQACDHRALKVGELGPPEALMQHPCDDVIDGGHAPPGA